MSAASSETEFQEPIASSALLPKRSQSSSPANSSSSQEAQVSRTSGSTMLERTDHLAESTRTMSDETSDIMEVETDTQEKMGVQLQQEELTVQNEVPQSASSLNEGTEAAASPPTSYVHRFGKRKMFKRRKGVHQLITGFDKLRSKLTSYAPERHLSKIDTLRMASSYIKDLQAVLKEDEEREMVAQRAAASATCQGCCLHQRCPRVRPATEQRSFYSLEDELDLSWLYGADSPSLTMPLTSRHSSCPSFSTLPHQTLQRSPSLDLSVFSPLTLPYQSQMFGTSEAAPTDLPFTSTQGLFDSVLPAPAAVCAGFPAEEFRLSEFFDHCLQESKGKSTRQGPTSGTVRAGRSSLKECLMHQNAEQYTRIHESSGTVHTTEQRELSASAVGTDFPPAVLPATHHTHASAVDTLRSSRAARLSSLSSSSLVSLASPASVVPEPVEMATQHSLVQCYPPTTASISSPLGLSSLSLATAVESPPVAGEDSYYSSGQEEFELIQIMEEMLSEED
eukprot:scpid54222/ scgid1788/ 